MPHIPKDEWLKRFVMKLYKIEPELGEPESAGLAQSIAEKTFPDACDLTPEEAAEIYALEQPPGDVGAPE